MAFSGGGPQQAEINVTPMIDILLVLIIVFMVVESMSQQKGLQAQIPQPAQQATVPGPERTIVVEIEAGVGQDQPELKINHQPVKWDDLPRRLREIFASRVEKVAFIEGDKDIKFDYVAQVIDTAHLAGVAHVGLITSPPKQEAGLR
jgi:biopolymer transport protein TolR